MQIIIFIFSFLMLFTGFPAYAENNSVILRDAETVLSVAGMKNQYRTFISFQKYTMESNGQTGNAISNVRIEVTFPSGTRVELPESGVYWPIGNGQFQEINRVYEIPWSYVQRDGFRLRLQMIRKGSTISPCEIEVAQLSAYNRAYICHTDVIAQMKNGTEAGNAVKEGVEIRIFTDLNSTQKEIPQNAIALR